MSDYQKLIKKEAKTFFDAAKPDFDADSEEHGGKSDRPNFAMWIDRTGRLTQRVEEIAADWTHKDHLWVKSNTRNKPKEGGGDPASIAFVSFFQDVKHEVKKVAKGKK